MDSTAEQIRAAVSELIRLKLDALAREEARRVLRAVLVAEVVEYVERYGWARDKHGRAEVVRNRQARQRQLTLRSGTVPVLAPRLNE